MLLLLRLSSPLFDQEFIAISGFIGVSSGCSCPCSRTFAPSPTSTSRLSPGENKCPKNVFLVSVGT